MMFDGKYHGHGDATLVVMDDGASRSRAAGTPLLGHRPGQVGAVQRCPALEGRAGSTGRRLVLTEPSERRRHRAAPASTLSARFRHRRLERLWSMQTHSLVGAYGGMARLDRRQVHRGRRSPPYGWTDEVAARHPTATTTWRPARRSRRSRDRPWLVAPDRGADATSVRPPLPGTWMVDEEGGDRQVATAALIPSTIRVPSAQARTNAWGVSTSVRAARPAAIDKAFANRVPPVAISANASPGQVVASVGQGSCGDLVGHPVGAQGNAGRDGLSHCQEVRLQASSPPMPP